MYTIKWKYINVNKKPPLIRKVLLGQSEEKGRFQERNNGKSILKMSNKSTNH